MGIARERRGKAGKGGCNPHKRNGTHGRDGDIQQGWGHTAGTGHTAGMGHIAGMGHTNRTNREGTL